jgi:serine phosphatase RsbU (regulator of sigma subunit)
VGATAETVTPGGAEDESSAQARVEIGPLPPGAIADPGAAGQAIASAETLEDLLKVVTEAARSLVGAHQGATSRLKEGWQDAITFVSMSEKYEEYSGYSDPPKGLGVLNYVTRQNRSLRLTSEELTAHPDYRGLRDTVGHPPLPDYLAAPLVSRNGSNIGLIQLSDKVDGSVFTQEDENLLVRLAQMASATLEHVEMLERERHLRQEMAEQGRVSRLSADIGIALTSDDSLADKLQRCAKAMVDHLGAAFARVWTLESDELLVLQASAGLYTHLDGPHSRIKVGDFKIGRIAATLEAHLTNDVPNDPHVSDKEWARREGMVAFAGYPLDVGGRCVGVAAAFSRQPFSESVITALGAVSDVVAIGIERERSKSDIEARSVQLRKLADTAAAVNGAASVNNVLEIVNVAAREIVGAHQSVTSLTRGPDWSQAITAVSLSEKYAEWADYAELPDGSGIYAWVCENQQPTRMTQAELEAHPRWRNFGSSVDVHPPMRGWLAVPLTASDGSNLGIIQLSDRVEGEFTADDESILVQLAEIASAGLNRAVLYEDRAQVAQALQMSLLPPVLPTIPGVDLDARYEAGTEAVGGDFYDVFPLRGRSWGIVVGDVRGKGPAAAAMTALARHSTRTASILKRRPSQVLQVVNDALLDNDEPERFCTAAFLKLTPSRSGVAVELASGGHPPIVIARASGETEEIQPTGPLVGLLPSISLKDAQVSLGPDDVLVVYTDGITEARRDGELFGIDRVKELVSNYRQYSADRIAHELVVAAKEYSDQTHDADDAAVVVIKAAGL